MSEVPLYPLVEGRGFDPAVWERGGLEPALVGGEQVVNLKKADQVMDISLKQLTRL